ncbi:hypothetical protein Q9189_005774 [Teloschistes chrysophthalmus]
MLTRSIYVLSLAASVLAHEQHHDQTPIQGPHEGLWYKPYENRIPGDGGTQADSVFSGISTFGRLPYFPCLASDQEKYDIAFIGSRKVRFSGGYNVPLDANPFNSWAKILDCGDIPVTSVVAAYGPVSVIHFDSHLDTWKPKVFGGAPTLQASINHGTYFYHAHAEGLLANDTNIHAGIRTTLSGLSDYDNDGYCGFQIVEAREIDTIGTAGIIKKIRDRVGTERPVYLSIDIDTLDPAFAPATGTPETGGWSTRELREIIRGLSYPEPTTAHSHDPAKLHEKADPINIVAADIVEVAPAYDTNAELTTMAAADTLFEVMGLMVLKGPMSAGKGKGSKEE